MVNCQSSKKQLNGSGMPPSFKVGFETINIAGKELTKQALRNAVFWGSWVSDANRYFSENTRPKIDDEYLSGLTNSQEYLETVIEWISSGNIKRYISDRQYVPAAIEFWNYFS